MIKPDKIGAGSEYEKVKELAPGLFIVKNKSGKEWITVFFMEYGMVTSIPKTCSWDTEKFPVKNSQDSKLGAQAS